MSTPLLRRLCWCLPALAVFALYWQVSNQIFTDFDDPVYTYNNAVVIKGLTWEGFVWAFSGSHAVNYHPLTWLSHMLDYDLFGNRSGAFALVNALFHAANATLVAALFTRLFRSRRIGVAVGIVFAVHPQLVEAVAWISQRKTVLCTFFGLATILLHLRALDAKDPSRRRWLYGAALGAYVLSLLAKGMLVTLPVLLPLLELVAAEQNRPRQALLESGAGLPALLRQLRVIALRMLPYAVLAFVFSLLTLWAQATGNAVYTLTELAPADRLANALNGFVTYLKHFFYPAGLSVYYNRNEHWGVGDVATAAGILLAITIGLSSLRRRTGYTPVLGWLFFLVALLPVIGLVQVGDQASADRYMYQPILGLLIAATALIGAIPGLRQPTGTEAQPATGTSHSGKAARPALFGLIVWSGACCFLGYKQVGYWHNSYLLAEVSMFNAGPNAQLLAMQTGMLLRAQEYQRAKELARKSLALEPSFLTALNNLAVAEAATGNPEEAVKILRVSIAFDGAQPAAYTNLAAYLIRLERRDEAKAALAEARKHGELTVEEERLVRSMENLLAPRAPAP